MTDLDLHEFLRESNAIEGEHSEQAFEDALNAWAQITAFTYLTIPRILGVHMALLARLNPSIAGKLRKGGVRVGLRACMPAEKVKSKLNILFEWEPSDAQQIKQWHIEFETIHPFRDGNGRVGRHIMNWQRHLIGLPLLVIHVGKEQQDYYLWFDRWFE